MPNPTARPHTYQHELETDGLLIGFDGRMDGDPSVGVDYYWDIDWEILAIEDAEEFAAAYGEEPRDLDHAQQILEAAEAGIEDVLEEWLTADAAAEMVERRLALRGD
jgi:hypothetical protein